jgi:hypothetical protein
MRPHPSDWARRQPIWWPRALRWRDIVTSASKMPDRFLLWVDAVGGYLVCLKNEIAIGQPVSSGDSPDVPILGDLSRRHAIVRREGESYSIEALRAVRVNGRTVQGRAPLLEGSTIDLGSGVQLRFRLPHPLSATARLEFVSPHRTQPSTSAVLLMADACIMGSAATSHVSAPLWRHEVVLFRQAEELACRTSATVQVDGVTNQGRSKLRARSRVEGTEFAFSLEPILGNR